MIHKIVIVVVFVLGFCFCLFGCCFIFLHQWTTFYFFFCTKFFAWIVDRLSWWVMFFTRSLIMTSVEAIPCVSSTRSETQDRMSSEYLVHYTVYVIIFVLVWFICFSDENSFPFLCLFVCLLLLLLFVCFFVLFVLVYSLVRRTEWDRWLDR